MAIDTVAAAAPASPATGATWFNTATATLSVWTGSEWARALPDPTPTAPGPVSVTVAGIASALRITADGAALDGDNAAILTRLGGVGEALVELWAAEAPTAIKSEAVIRVAAYLYDMPESPAGFRYAAAWTNSGAALLVQPWTPRRAVFADAEVVAAAVGPAMPGGGGGDGLTAADVNRLIAAYLAANPPSGGGGGLTASQVDDRIAALVEDWAEHGNDDVIPTPKIDPGFATTAGVTSAIQAHKDDAGAHHDEPTLADLGGVTEAQADGRVRAYTGQASETAEFASGRLPLATASQRGAVSGAHYFWYFQRRADPRYLAAAAAKLAGIAAGANAYRLPVLADEFARDLSGGGWTVVADAIGNAHSGGQPTAGQIVAYTYTSGYQVGTRVTNQRWPFRLPAGTMLDDYQIRVSDDAGQYPFVTLESNTAVKITTAGGFDYYTILIADKPAGDFVVLMRFVDLSAERFTLPIDQITGMPGIAGLTASDAGDFPAYNHTTRAYDNASFGNTPTVTWIYDADSATWRATAASGATVAGVAITTVHSGAGTGYTAVGINQRSLFYELAKTADLADADEILWEADYAITGAPAGSLFNGLTDKISFTGFASGATIKASGNAYRATQSAQGIAIGTMPVSISGGSNTGILTAYIATDPDGYGYYYDFQAFGGTAAYTVTLDSLRVTKLTATVASSIASLISPTEGNVRAAVTSAGRVALTAAGGITMVADGVTLSRTHANRGNAIAVPGVTVPEGRIWAIAIKSAAHEYSMIVPTDIIRGLPATTAGTAMSAANAIILGGAFGFGYAARTTDNGLLIAANSGTDSDIATAQPFDLYIIQF